MGLALVEKLLEEGDFVAASGRSSAALRNLEWQYDAKFLLLDGNLSNPLEATAAAQQIYYRWGALDCLIINAGTSDYLASDVSAATLFASLVRSNLNAARYCLDSALTLLQSGNSPQLVGILSRYSALQLNDPSHPPGANNSLTGLFEAHRAALAAQFIDMTLIAALNRNSPQTSASVTPERWTAKSAAEVIVEHLPKRQGNLVLEALHQHDLWPLPK
ncbi:SDR family NAD(P)-dependent oxidoreductase [Pseudomonas sp. DG56-2]|uniref:SDR family NAD(P)-dependent oxidoreductase n=1 Tax=Pseudomonas sp. DG56-2 TaxID=2320270 RepID=UPI00143CF153|nr:SDR family NAD(P)-dependent oxidoreductase [Pseudomonas sp. DG56-2]